MFNLENRFTLEVISIVAGFLTTLFFVVFGPRLKAFFSRKPKQNIEDIIRQSAKAVRLYERSVKNRERALAEANRRANLAQRKNEELQALIVDLERDKREEEETIAILKRRIRDYESAK